ncbi:FYN-binding protein 2 isoform X1 [Sagmatias obliquidens]|uniref:FYN-binding protein 2 isoform X1 n=1 Tax=Sagmatias obliquidens TaxID=3371155 RepID=UPI000F4428DD|nr:FYN-binding protein 2 isoform X1 [Lagenorhynchus obliquidens]
MEGEVLRNFKELRAKFQKLDAPSLPGPVKFPEGVSQKGDTGSRQSTKTLASGKYPSSNHNEPLPNCASGDSQTLKPQKVKLAQKSDTQKCSNSLEPPESSSGSSVNSQKASLLLDVNQSNAEITNKKKVMVNNSFRKKLWNWEVLSQKSKMSSVFIPGSCGSRAFHLEERKSMGLTPEEPRKKMERKGGQTLPSQRRLMAQRRLCATSEDPTVRLSQHSSRSPANPSPEKSPAGSTCHPVYDGELTSQAPEDQPDVSHPQLPNTKPLPSVKSLGPPPAKPPRPPVVNLQAFQTQAAALPKTHREAAGEEGDMPPESAEFEEPHHSEATISCLRHSSNSINLCTTKEMADSTYEVRIEELQKPWKSFLHQGLSLKHEDEDKKMKEKEPCKLEPRKTEKDLCSDYVSKVGAYEDTPGKTQMVKVHRGRRSTPAGKQDAEIDVIQTEDCPKDPKLARHSDGHWGYVKALEMTKETPGQGAFKPNSISETYDDVEYPGREGAKSDFSNSFVSDNENSEEMYEEVYRTKSNYPKIDLDGKEALKRLQRFFKKEKDRFKMKKSKSKEKISAFSISLPDLELRSQEVTIYDDVDIKEKKSNDEDKLKTWKPKFLISKGKKEKNGAKESERNFFKTKKQNLEKNRMEREEKCFRERFKYDKEITVMNTAVACSNNSRNGIFDLPITPGEELEVIDITEENLVICRNSKGKYGYVLIEHLDFKHEV